MTVQLLGDPCQDLLSARLVRTRSTALERDVLQALTAGFADIARCVGDDAGITGAAVLARRMAG